MVVTVQGSGLGVKPAWYLICEPEQKPFVVDETQSVIAWFFFVCKSCCLIEVATCFSGVDCRGLTAVSGSITNHDLYCVGS